MEHSLKAYNAYLWAMMYIDETHPDGNYKICDVIDYLYPNLNADEKLEIIYMFSGESSQWRL